ncbi:MAG: Cof-type HAD-IIB family hydrolase [Oscillospiraceae bacterium]|nr:Cof-type HAD-IIB family hydrolase [Oscillospiraceae bacterium]
MKASDFTVLSDLDGTLIQPDGIIPQRNIQAIGRFQKRGGRFGIATGRSPIGVIDIAEKLSVTAPCICFNGGLLRDFATGETLMSILLPDAAKNYIEFLLNSKMPAGLVVMTHDRYWDISDKPELDTAQVEGYARARYASSSNAVPWRSITDPWHKLLAVILPEQGERWMRYIKQYDTPGVYFTFSAPHLLEMIPLGVSKAAGVRHLIEKTGLRRECVACIGDYYNDADMIALAGIGAATAGAPQDIKATADIITGPYENGAVADLIEHIERTYGY